MNTNKANQIKKLNSNRKIRQLAREMRSNFIPIPFSGGKTQTETRYITGKFALQWMKDIINKCQIGPYESSITNRFICEVLDILITNKQPIINQTERHVHADFYTTSILHWLAEDEKHLQYIVEIQERKKNVKIHELLRKAQLIRKQEIANIIIKILQTTKGTQ